MNYLNLNVYKYPKHVDAVNINKDGVFLDAELKPKVTLKLKSTNVSKLNLDLNKNAVYKITNINASKKTFLERKPDSLSFLNLLVVKNKTESGCLKQLTSSKTISAVELNNKNNDIILASSKVEINSSIKTGIVGDAYVGNGSFTIELQKGRIYQFSFPTGFLNNLTNFDFVNKISSDTIKVIPNRYGIFTLYCDGGVIVLKIAPGSLKN